MTQKEKENTTTMNNTEKKSPEMNEQVSGLPMKENTGFCVGVGASAGGLEALEQFFKNMPSDSGLSFVVVQHLSPDYKSLMVELLSKHTMMQVLRAEDGMKVEPNCIYLIPPKKNMTVFHGTLFLTDQKHNHVINLPIDIFFRSLAEDYGDKSVGVILSGTGSDGTLGIRAIKGIGGMVMAQDDHSAKFDGMPRSAIATGMVDYVLPADQMPEELLKYIKHPLTSKALEKENLSSHENTLVKILSIIRTITGVDFTYYKPNTIIRRLERRITINQISSYENYVTFLEQSVKEVNILYKELLIGVTRFFRDHESFDILREQVIPQIFKNKNKDEPIRLWSVGCSTGEEAYSLAMLLKEHMDENGYDHDIKIFATDLDKESIEYGSMGFYPESIVADVNLERLKKFFIKKDKGYQIKENIRKMVIFATHNIIKDPPFSKIDLISCRNMLIYLKPLMQKRVLSLFHFSLHKQGYLFLGSSESLGDLSRNFDTINSKWKIYSFKDNFTHDNIGDFLIPSLHRSGSNTSVATEVSVKGHASTGLTDTIYSSIIEEFIPPSVIIDENFEIVHILKDVSKYVKLAAGKASLDLLTLIRKEISTALSIAIHKALKENKEIIYNDFKLREKGEIIELNIKVKPFAEKFKSRKLLFVAFEEQKTIKSIISDSNSQSIEYDTNQQIKDLELELKYTKENLQATIEELGTSNEELQATNEELISSNEELQSTNEELQSVNEELYTVNSEYQNKIDILTQLNNDINNLLKNTNIGTVFLDRNLHIRKYTPAVTSAINILEMDIGRPIHHISHNTLYDNFLEDIENVLRTLVIKEVEVQGKKDNWFLMRILPYRTLENAIDGVVITFFDITERKKFEKQIQQKSNLLISVLDNSPVASTILDKKGKVTYANHMAEKVLGLTKDEITKRNYNTPRWKITHEDGTDFPDDQLPFQIVSRSGEPVFDVVHNIEWPDGTKKTLSINGSPIFDENRKVDGVICTLLDITQKREYEEKLSREHDLLIRILQNSPNAKIMTNNKGRVTFANKLASQLFNISEAKINNGLSFDELPVVSIHSPEDGNVIIKEVVTTGKTLYNQQYIFKSKQRANETLFITASPAYDSQKKVSEVVMAIDSHSNQNINFDLLNKQLSSISNLIDTGIFTLDNKSTITTWNRKAEEITGLKARTVMGKSCYSAYQREQAHKELPCFLLNDKRNTMQCKHLIINIDDKPFQIEANNIEVIKNSKGQVIGAMGFFGKVKK